VPFHSYCYASVAISMASEDVPGLGRTTDG